MDKNKIIMMSFLLVPFFGIGMRILFTNPIKYNKGYSNEENVELSLKDLEETKRR